MGANGNGERWDAGFLKDFSKVPSIRRILQPFIMTAKQKKYQGGGIYAVTGRSGGCCREKIQAVLLEDMAGENSEAVRKAQEDSERAETESEAGTEYVETLAGVPYRRNLFGKSIDGL